MIGEWTADVPQNKHGVTSRRRYDGRGYTAAIIHAAWGEPDKWGWLAKSPNGGVIDEGIANSLDEAKSAADVALRAFDPPVIQVAAPFVTHRFEFSPEARLDLFRAAALCGLLMTDAVDVGRVATIAEARAQEMAKKASGT